MIRLFLLFLSIFSFQPLSLIKSENNVKTREKQPDFNIRNYRETDSSFEKIYTQPLTIDASSPNNSLYELKNYLRTFEIKLDIYDKDFINRNLFPSFLEFDFEENLVSEGHRSIAQTHVVQELNFKKFQNEFVTNDYNVYFTMTGGAPSAYPNQSLLKFSFTKEGNIAFTTNRTINYPIMEKYTYISKRLTRVENIKLIFQKPQIFNNLNNYQINVPYNVDSNSINNLDIQIAKYLKSDLEFDKYLEIAKLTNEQKTLLLYLDVNLQKYISIQILVKPEYNHPIIKYLLNNKFLRVKFAQKVDLSMLNIKNQLSLKEGENPIKEFLKTNIVYKAFMEQNCLLEYDIKTKKIFITGKNDLITNNLSIQINFYKPKPPKQDLNSLNLKNNLGLIQVETNDWYLSDEFYFKKWKNQNMPILIEQKLEDYIVGSYKTGVVEITASTNNEKFYGTVQIFLQVETPEDRKIDIGSLNLITNLGLINLENEINPEIIIFNKLLTLNKEKTVEFKYDDFLLFIDNEFGNLTAKKTNKHFKGSIFLTFESFVEVIKTNINNLDLINDFTYIELDINLLNDANKLFDIWFEENKTTLNESKNYFNFFISNNILEITVKKTSKKYEGSISAIFRFVSQPANTDKEEIITKPNSSNLDKSSKIKIIYILVIVLGFITLLITIWFLIKKILQKRKN
ncbi:hypothetical protein ESOMN_v1c02130 [Williamsoniiplasma somnilux]|uniref:Uncharacterized protein n=1 Tax=Williamsoniiplasma somnilux TaxID=215578 RepID=A0A2K8NXS8_9MOLU|nr:hypothetical protein [Williamsoniiplasma somnilux]ATZ18597.1 hypothetical protein ESOMN_v1c02130 [Williamsoniiplasma somnilux]